MPTKKPPPPTLSAYLAKKASVFSIYPHRDYSQEVSSLLDSFVRELVEWRKTFEPKSGAAGRIDLFGRSEMLDQFYARDLLSSVPGIVGRTLQLRQQVSFIGISAPESVVYLREAANCYIQGLFQGSVALARAALESALRAKVTTAVGARIVEGMMFGALVKDYGRMYLKADGVRSAELVRDRAKEVLHENAVADAATALAVFEAARATIVQLGR